MTTYDAETTAKIESLGPAPQHFVMLADTGVFTKVLDFPVLEVEEIYPIPQA